MATASRAIDQVAKTTRILPATVFRAARALREADVNLWPQGTQGRGKEAHVEPGHLVNLMLALAVADPITTAPRLVADYRDLIDRVGHYVKVVSGTVHTEAERLGHTGLLLSDILVAGGNLGTALERVIDLLAKNKASQHYFTEAYFKLEFTLDPLRASCMIRYYANDVDPEVSERSREFLYLSRQASPSTPQLPILRKVVIDATLFSSLADLWADTLQHRSTKRARCTSRIHNPL